LCFEDGKGEVFSECKPYCQKETIEYIKNEYETNKDFFKNVKYLDFNVFKSGSVGEVHKGIYKDDKDIIIKVQYVGLYEQFQNDFTYKIIKNIFAKTLRFQKIKNNFKNTKCIIISKLIFQINFL
jgi:predicted unusual protein kinase regulating ubiquinone biosynthesis (AarF/ABC1/UbiB family)